MSSVSSLVELRQHYFKFPEVCSLCVLLWKWRRTYNRAVVRPLVSSGWTRRTENLRKKCKLRSDAKHGSRGDLARELYGVFFLVQPREASSWSRVIPMLHSPGCRCNQTNGDLIFKDGTRIWTNTDVCGGEGGVLYAPPLDGLGMSNLTNCFTVFC